MVLLGDLLTSPAIELILAHAKYLKAIAYAKVKTDKVDARTMAQLLRMNDIPRAHKIRPELRETRDLTRARLRVVNKRTGCYNSIHHMGEKYNCDHLLDDDKQIFPEDLPESARAQEHYLCAQITLLTEHITHPSNDVQHFTSVGTFTIHKHRCIPGIFFVSP